MTTWYDRIWNPVGTFTCQRDCCAMFMARCGVSRLSFWPEGERVLVGPADLFSTDVPDAVIRDLFMVMARCEHLTFKVLVRNAYRMEQWFGTWECTKLQEWLVNSGIEFPPPNIELGVIVKDEETASDCVGALLGSPVAARFVVIERLLEPVDLTAVECPAGVYSKEQVTSCTLCMGDRNICAEGRYNALCEGIGEVVLVHLKKSNAADHEWRSLIIEQCRAHDVPVILPTLRGHDAIQRQGR